MSELCSCDIVLTQQIVVHNHTEIISSLGRWCRQWVRCTWQEFNKECHLEKTSIHLNECWRKADIIYMLRWQRDQNDEMVCDVMWHPKMYLSSSLSLSNWCHWWHTWNNINGLMQICWLLLPWPNKTRLIKDIPQKQKNKHAALLLNHYTFVKLNFS